VSEVPQVDFPRDHFELVVLRVGPQASGMDAAQVQRLGAAHIAYLFELQRAGSLLAAGAVGSRMPGQVITGIGFFRLGSVEAVRELMDRDPAVAAGLESAEVLPFMCPKGSLAFPERHLRLRRISGGRGGAAEMPAHDRRPALPGAEHAQRL
jgi:uncharacterized protein YciI